MKKVEIKYNKIRNGREITEGYCPNCWGIVRRCEHGTDEECPVCDMELDWSDKNE